MSLMKNNGALRKSWRCCKRTVKQGKPLPENIQSLVDFMNETGGTIEDYVRLNHDYLK